MERNYTPRRSSPPPRRSSAAPVSSSRRNTVHNTRRRRKSGPPLFPILILLLIVIIAVVVILLVSKGCSSDTDQGSNNSNTSSLTSQVSQSEATSGTSEGTTSGETSNVTSQATPSPSPASQEEPQTAPETVDALMLVGDTAYEYYNFKEDVTNQYITAVSDAGKKLSGTSTGYDMVIPTSIDIMLPESYLEKNQVNSSDQRKVIEEYIYPSIQAMNSSVKTVSLFDALKSHANEYLYFRTDHHWTQLGAYYAYVEFCKVRGFEPVALDQFDKKEYAGFLGSFYSASASAAAALGGNPDTVEAYVPKANVTLDATQKDGQVLENWPLIADGDTYSDVNKYLVFCAGDQPYEEISNNDMTDGPSCIVVKESFGNCFIPFLVNHYQKIYVVDYRDYQGTVSQLAQEKGVDDVICVNNISMTRNGDLVDQFTNIF